MSGVLTALAVVVAAIGTGPRRRARAVVAKADLFVLVGAALRRPVVRRQVMACDRLLGLIVVVAVPVALVDLRLVPVAWIGLWAHDVARLRRSSIERAHAISRELPEVTDLFALALVGGGSIHGALELVARRPIGPVSERLARAQRSIVGGARLGDELEAALDDLGPPARPLIRALTGAEHYGTSIEPALRRVAAEARATRRRDVETRARRIPVRLLGPLVLGVLPAFVLLTVVPTVARTLQGLSLTPGS